MHVTIDLGTLGASDDATASRAASHPPERRAQPVAELFGARHASVCEAARRACGERQGASAVRFEVGIGSAGGCGEKHVERRFPDDHATLWVQLTERPAAAEEGHSGGAGGNLERGGAVLRSQGGSPSVQTGGRAVRLWWP